MAYNLMIAALSASSSPLPAFPKNFYSGIQQSVAQKQGEAYWIDNGACCSAEHASRCTVQIYNIGYDYYEYPEKNMTRSDSAHGSTVHMYEDGSGKEMAVVPGNLVNSTHKWACVQFCPLAMNALFFSSLYMGKDAKDLGSESVTQPKYIGGDTRQCKRYHWIDGLIGRLFKIDTQDFYIDQSGSHPVPFYKSDHGTPFGQDMLYTNTSYIGFKPMDVTDWFDVDPDSIKTCPQSDKCQPPSLGGGFADAHSALVRGVRGAELSKYMPMTKTGGKSVLEQAAKIAAATPKAEGDGKSKPYPQPNITFIKDFTSNMEFIQVQAGGNVKINGDLCCSTDNSNPQCQVNQIHQKGMAYHDVTNQQARFDDIIAGTSIISDFKRMMQYYVNTTGPVETCIGYCPINVNDTFGPLDPFNKYEKTTYLGKTTYAGKTVEHYQQVRKMMHIIPMLTDDIYVDESSPTGAIPVWIRSLFTPFGHPGGDANQTWTNVQPGPPASAKFNVSGVDTCPIFNNCKTTEMQANAMQHRLLHTLAARTLSPL